MKDSDLILLDEPLANLDYKLREELRDELPKLFSGRNAIVVYATTEPTEALLFGGNTATLHEGRVTQFGPTSQTYRRPRDLITAQVFSDPPINTAKITKKGNEIILSDQIKWPAGKAGTAIPDGDYTLAIRPHHISPIAHGNGHAVVEGRVLVTELSGSESVIHFDLNGRDMGVAVAWHPSLRGRLDRQALCRCRPEPVLRCEAGARILMAKITLDGLKHSYYPNPTREEDWALEAPDARTGRMAAPMRCSDLRAAARPRCSI